MSTSVEQKLLRIETRLKKLIEGSAALIFPKFIDPYEIFQNIVQAMKENIKQDQKGLYYAPDQFRIRTDPDTAKILVDNPEFINELLKNIEVLGEKEEISFYNTPSFTIESSGELQNGQLEIIAEFSNDPLPHTSAISLTEIENSKSNLKDGFLIVNGVDVFLIDQKLINIGRKYDNQLVINDPRVSRQHAQIRFIKGNFFIFDLGSSGGTFVNGNRVQQSQLYPGDVISLAGVPIVFGEESPQIDETGNFTHRIQLNENED